MSRGRKQILIASIALVAVLACYFGVREYSAGVTQKQEEEDALKIRQVTNFDIADVTAFSYNSADLMVSMAFDGESWVCTTDDTVEIDTEKVESFLQNFNFIESENEITEAGELESFGLEQPMSSITFTFEDQTSLTCKVGDYNDVMSVYYFMTDADEAIYTVSGTVANKLSNTLENFVVEEEEETEVEQTE